MMARCLIGMSGGVDSCTAAYLLQKAGYDCIGVTMRLCPTAKDDSADAAAVCARLGIPHHTVDLTAEFRQNVMDPFVRDYEAGLTPNPCIACNQTMKFRRMWELAKELGCEYLATGHYARIERDKGIYRLLTAANAAKDQSYVLYFLSQEQLSHTLFPLGGLSKPQVRAIAEAQGFVSANRPESQDICFIPDGDYGNFMERHTGKTYPHGDFIDRGGNVLGRHTGAVRYTLGQRRGLGVPAATRLYVTGKNMENNTVTLGSNEELFTDHLYARDVFFTVSPVPAGTVLTAKVRYRQAPQPCRVYPEETGLRVEFDTPQRAVTSGQAVVLYDGETVVGGGTIL